MQSFSKFIIIILLAVSAVCSHNIKEVVKNYMPRLTHANYDSTMNVMTFTPTQAQLVAMGAEIGLPEWYMIMVIGTTEGEGYVFDYYLNYEWACCVINYIMESYDLRWEDKNWAYNYMRGWDDETVRPGDLNHYSEYQVTQRYYNCTADNLKVVYLALMNRDRNTRACSGDYYYGAYYAYYTSAQYPDISVWYLPGATVVDDSGVTPSGIAISFTERTSSPAGTYNPCYMTNGGPNALGYVANNSWNTCITGEWQIEGLPNYGQPSPGANSLPNCTGYAQGRALEIYNECMSYNPNTTLTHPFIALNQNAGEWYDIAQTVGIAVNPTTPAPGAIMCWGEVGSAGHVEVVEEVVDSDTVRTTGSAYGAWAFGADWCSMTRVRGDGNWLQGTMWGMPGSYYFRGFLYNPANPGPPGPGPGPTPTPTKKGSNIIYQRNWNNTMFRRLL